MRLKMRDFARALGLILFLAFAGVLPLRAAESARPAATNAVVTVDAAQPLSLTTTVTPKKQVYLTFGLNQFEPLRQQVFGMPLWQYLASAIYIVLALLISRFLNYLICVQLKKHASKTATRLDDLLLTLIHGPVKIVAFVIFLHIGLQVFDWPFVIEHWLKKALQLLVAISLTYMLLKLVDMSMSHWRARLGAREDKTFNDQLLPVITNSLKTFLVIVAILLTSQNLGLDITSLLASLSIGGLALGLAAQDTVANLFGAVAVFMDKPFRIGDTIKLDNVEGTVETIGLRSTRVRNVDGYLITVPNKTMGNATITNITRRPTIKTEMNIGITYDTPPAKIREAVAILTEVYKGHPKTADLLVSFNRFAGSALNIQVVHWWGSLDNKAYLAGMQELNLAVKERFDAAGIQFAFPSQTVYLKQDSEWKMEEKAGEMTNDQTPNTRE